MPAVTTYRNIQDRTLDLLGKSDTTTRNRVKNWINMGQSDFVLRELWPFREITGTLNTSQGTQEYSLSSNFATMDAQNIISVAIQGASQSKLTYWPYNQLRANQPDFDYIGTGIPTRYYIKSGSIGFWPSPDATYSVAIDYFNLPTEMSDDADEPSLPVDYREALVQYAVSLEHDFNTDPDLAQKAMNRYEEIVTLARQNLLSQPTDTGNFTVRGPADSRSWLGLSGEI